MTLKIGSPVATTVSTVAVDRGDHVRKGDIIARLESRVEEAEIAVSAARAQDSSDMSSRAAKVEFAQSEAARGESLLQNNNIARQKVDELRTNLRVAQQELQASLSAHRVAELDLQRAKALLEQKIIRSPIDGTVVSRLLGPGEYVHQDTQIVEIANITPLNVEAYPPVKFFGTIKVGAQAVVRPDAPVGSSFTATVTIVDQVFDAGSGTFGVRLSLPNKDGTLPGGLRCRVDIDSGGS